MANALQVDFLISGLIATDGLPLIGGTVEFFETDGVTPKIIWEDGDKLTTSANPVTLDIRGTACIFADGVYSLEVKDSLGNVVKTPELITFDTSASSAAVLGIDATLFGSGDDSDAIQQAITSAGGDPANVFLRNIGLSGWNIDQNLTIPTNINLEYLYGAFTTVQTGITLNVQGTTKADLFNIFRGPGTVTIDDRNNDIPSIWLQGGIHDNRILDGVVGFPDQIQAELITAIDQAPSTPVIVFGDALRGSPGALIVSDDFSILEPDALVTINGVVSADPNPRITTLQFIGQHNTANAHFQDINWIVKDLAGASISFTGIQMAGIKSPTADRAEWGLLIWDGAALQSRLRVDAVGNLGLSTTSPDFRLDVAGEVRIQSANRLRFAGTGAGDSEGSIFRNALNELTIDVPTLNFTGTTVIGILNVTTVNATTVNATTVSTTDVNATNLTGTLLTAAQPNVTSLGTLTGLTVDGTLTIPNGKPISMTGVGSQITIASGNIGITLGDITLTSGNFNTISGSVDTQTVNTNTLAISTQIDLQNNPIINGSTITAVTLSGTNVSGTNITGTINTGVQPNITSLGTLGSLNVSGITDTDSISFIDDPASTEIKMIAITFSNWDMDTDAVRVINLLIPSTATILEVFGIIQDDSNAENYTIPLTDPSSATWEVVIERVSRNPTDVSVRMQRRATGLFDSVSFSAVGVRGSLCARYTD